MVKTVSRGKGADYHGMNWIRKEKRLAIYLRDGLACAWCGADVEGGARLTLDHVTPYSQQGSTDAANLVTACNRCNASRGTRTVRVFATAVAGYLNRAMTPAAILAHVHTTRQRPIDVAAAKALIARRGGFVNAVNGAK